MSAADIEQLLREKLHPRSKRDKVSGGLNGLHADTCMQCSTTQMLHVLVGRQLHPLVAPCISGVHSGPAASTRIGLLLSCCTCAAVSTANSAPCTSALGALSWACPWLVCSFCPKHSVLHSCTCTSSGTGDRGPCRLRLSSDHDGEAGSQQWHHTQVGVALRRTYS